MSHNPQIKTPFVGDSIDHHHIPYNPDVDPNAFDGGAYWVPGKDYAPPPEGRRCRFERVLSRVTMPFNWKLKVVYDPKSRYEDPRFWLCVHADDDVDVRTGEAGYAWDGREWYLDENMTDSQILRAAYLAAKGAVEHEFNEMFQIDGGRPFDPHINLLNLSGFTKDPDNTDQP